MARHINYSISVPEEFREDFKEAYPAFRDSYNLTIKLTDCTPAMAQFLWDKTDVDKKKYRTFRGDLRGVLSSFEGAEGSCALLRLLPVFILRSFQTLESKWFFRRNHQDGHLLAYYLGSVTYTKRDQYSPEAVTLAFTHSYRGEVKVKEHTIYAEFLRQKFPGRKFKRGLTANEIITLLDYEPETPQLVDEYNATHQRYLQIKPHVGRLHWGTGRVCLTTGFRPEWVSLSREEAKARILIDDDFPDSCSAKERKTPFPNLDFWLDTAVNPNDDTEDEEAEDEPIPDIPAHPYLHGFNLDKHQFIYIHSDSLKEYKFDTSLADKLILPPDIKELNSILIQNTDSTVGDVVAGKSQGTLILASGGPGRGKTLTAEVYSESVQRPLYVVNCSQLGISVEDIEKNLSEVLYRNRRWNAILLFDEADVYIHARGKDLVQNAIVGVFLRALERFEGVLFMTTNRATSVDDAILSRTTVHIRYPLPTAKDIASIWRVQSDVQGIPITDELIVELVEAFPVLSGRDIRSLLRLSARIAETQGTDLTASTVQRATQFKDLSTSESACN
jgi:hypothetical protein